MPIYKDTSQNRKLFRVGKYYTRKGLKKKSIKRTYIKRTTYVDSPKNRALNRVGIEYDSSTDTYEHRENIFLRHMHHMKMTKEDYEQLDLIKKYGWKYL